MIEDERFRHLNTRWSFWVVSNELDASAKRKTRQLNCPPGRIYASDDGMVEVWVKSWAEVLDACKSRMKFVQDKLNANVDTDSALKYLKKTYEKHLIGVAEEHSEELEPEVVEN